MQRGHVLCSNENRYTYYIQVEEISTNQKTASSKLLAVVTVSAPVSIPKPTRAEANLYVL